MADSKISGLPAVATPAGTDEFAVNQAGTSKKITLSQILAEVPESYLTYFEEDGTALATAPTADGGIGSFAIGDGSESHDIHAGVVGGLNNVVRGAELGDATRTGQGEFSAIVGGEANVIEASYAATIAGDTCWNVQARNAVMLAGLNNRLSGNSRYSAIIGGSSHHVDATRTVVLGGAGAKAKHQNSVLAGDSPRNFGNSELVFGFGESDNYHPRQWRKTFAEEVTLDATTANLDNNADLPNTIYLQDNKTFFVKGSVVARQISGAAGAAGDSAVYEVTAACKMEEGVNANRFYATAVADSAGSLDGTYFVYSTPSNDYYVWFAVEGYANTDPAPATRTGTRVNIPENATASEIVQCMMRDLESGPVDVMATVYTADSYLFENLYPGAVTAEGQGTSGFTLTNLVTGAGSATGNVTLLGTPTVTTVGSDAAAASWTVAVAVGDNGLDINVTGEANKNIRWVGSFEVTETS